MKILLINPNSDPEMTSVIQTAADDFANGDFEVICRPTPSAPKFIDSYMDEIDTAAGMVQLLKQHEDAFDGFVIACQDDPNLDAMKEMTDKPVVGIAEASMKIASMLGHKFSIVSTSRTSIPNHEVQARKYHLQDALASVRAPGDDMAGCSDEEKYMWAAQTAVQEDMAEVIVLGCAGMADLARRMSEQLGVPVLDGVVCGLTIVTGLVRAGFSTSKIGRYRPRPSKAG
ncbi:MAG: Asp/Glu/hydantoin racemase [Chloroflexi bacterium]|nr:Asp/Glu/hydantoin racemase [Chloroflexota bacterium]